MKFPLQERLNIEMLKSRQQEIKGIAPMNMTIVYALISAFYLLFSQNSAAAELKEIKTSKTIIFEGDIEEGDYEKLLNFILEKGVTYRTIYLASKGGNASEAMKIGRLIRALNYKTETGESSPQGNVCYKQIKQENCTCLSSCPLIYLSGVKRFGDTLGVHRIYLNHENLKKLSLDDAKNLSQYLEVATEKYLEEMGSPRSLSEKMQSAASDNIVLLDKEYVASNLSGYIHGYDEYLIATCGSSVAVHRELRNSKGENPKLIDKLIKILECSEAEIFHESQQKFKDTIDEAIKNTNPKYIPSQSLLGYLKANRVQDMADLLGKQAVDVMKLLALFGIGDYYKSQGFKFKDESYGIDGNIEVLFDTEGTLHNISLSFYQSEDYKFPYKGAFIKGVSTRSDPEKFISEFGKPIKSGCYEANGVCALYFENKRFSAKVGFESDKKTPRFIQINKSGYWSKLISG